MSTANLQNRGSVQALRCTVVIPNYNNARFLREAVKSAVTQDYPNKQVIVVDDASTDKSIETLLTHLDGHNQPEDIVVGKLIRGLYHDVPVGIVLLNQNQGPSHARNVAIKLTWDSSDIFANLDSDDYWLPGKMSKCIKPLLKWPGIVGASYSDYYNLNIKTGVKVPAFKEPYNRARLQERCIAHSGIFVTKETLAMVIDREKEQFYDEEMRTAEDWDLWLRISDHRVIYHVPEFLTVARVHDNNSASMYNMEVWKQNWKRLSQKRHAK